MVDIIKEIFRNRFLQGALVGIFSAITLTLLLTSYHIKEFEVLGFRVMWREKCEDISTEKKNEVKLVGAFVSPGSYKISGKERLSEIIAKAGGFTAEAYPYGAIYTSLNARIAECQSIERLAVQTLPYLVALSANELANERKLHVLNDILDRAVRAGSLGRVVIEADPIVLQVKPELDVVMQPGDQIFIPVRSNFVIVEGEVFNPGAKQFIAKLNLQHYIDLAGGTTAAGDRRRGYITLPN